MLTTQFETLRMTEEQTIAEFHMQIRDTANTSFALGEKMSDEKLVRKILRSLPKRFAMKVTAIEEAQDISNMQVDEIIGSLQTFELTFNDRSEKKNKSIAFVTSIEGVEEESEMDLAGEFTEALALLGRKFNKAFKKFDRRSRPNVT
jgi:excinuclease UvrABC nuclease subunit